MEVISVIGPLGSGKTTTVNELIQHVPIGESFAVVVNDVGTENIDADRIADHKGNQRDSVVALTAGCIGCSDVTQFREAIHGVAEAEIDLLFIEPTGIAPGHEIVDVVRSSGYDMSVLTLVNTENVKRDMKYQVLPSQLAVADIIGLTHIRDTEDSAELIERVLEDLPALSSSIELRLLQSERIDGQFLAELRGLRKEYDVGSSALLGSVSSEHTHSHEGSHGVTAQSLAPRAGADVAALKQALAELARLDDTPLLRAKGIVGGIEFDVVGDTWNQKELASNDTKPEKLNIIFAGGALPREAATLTEFVEDDIALQVSHDKKEVVKSVSELPINERVEIVEDIITQYPEPISKAHGELIPDCEADNGYEICFWPGEGVEKDMPEDVKKAAMKAYVDFRLQGLRTLQNQPETIANVEKKREYWLRRYGATLGFNGYHLKEYIEEDALAEIRAAQPERLLAEGFLKLDSLTFDDGRAEEKPEFIAAVLKAAQDAGHIDSSTEEQVVAHGMRLSQADSQWHQRWQAYGEKRFGIQ